MLLCPFGFIPSNDLEKTGADNPGLMVQQFYWEILFQINIFIYWLLSPGPDKEWRLHAGAIWRPEMQWKPPH